MYDIEFPEALNTNAFLKKYWQQKPLYMPQAWPDFENPFSAEELAGLALDEQIPARIVEQHSADKWTVRSGPFTERDFAELDGKTWSLLITDIEKHLPDLMDYVQPFRFIPDWRFDDFMISYAPPGGSVGPHIDDYDVFLIQAEGQRNWQLESDFRSLPQADDDLIADTDLRLIKHFKPQCEYLCSPGDILYLPPRIGHHGIATTDCMTWSMGFKAPNLQDMLIDYLDAFSTQNEHERYTDIGLPPQEHPGEITPPQIQALKAWFSQQLKQDDEAIAKWLGKFLSRDVYGEPLGDMLDPAPGDTLKLSAGDSINIEPNPFVRFNFIRSGKQILLYVGGEEYKVSESLARQLTGKSRVKIHLVQEKDANTVYLLLKSGLIYQTD